MSSLFKKNQAGQIICLENDIIVHISKRYENFAALNIELGVTTMGIFNIRYKGEDYGYNLPAMINMSPTLIEDDEINGEEYYKLTFKKDDVFINTLSLVQRTDLVFAIFKLFVFFGVRYPYMTPTNISRLFDVFYLTGFNMQYTDSAVPAAMFSELTRSSVMDIQSLHRHNPKSAKGYPVGMKNIAATASKLTTKLAGSYLKDTLTSALVNQNTQESEIENLLRR